MSQRAAFYLSPPGGERSECAFGRIRGEHLCWLSSTFWSLCLPETIGADEGVGEDNELTGDGDESLLFGLSVCGQALEESLHGLIEALGGDGSQIEDVTDDLTPAADVACATAIAGIIGPGCEAAERGNLLVVAAAELGKPGEEGHGHDVSETRNGDENIVTSGQPWIGIDSLEGLRLERFDMLGDLRQSPFELAAQKDGRSAFELVGERGLLLDGAATGLHELLERLDDLGCRRPGLGQAGGKYRQHPCIELIGLGEQAHGLGKQPGTQRVDDANRITVIDQVAVKVAMPFPGRLDRDQLHVVTPQPANDLLGTCLRVGNTEGFLGGEDVDIEPQFADIDSHGRLGLGLLFGPILALHAGLAPHHLFRTRAEERMDHAPPAGLSPKGAHGPIRSRRGPRPWSPAPNHFAMSRQMASPSESAKSTYKGAAERVSACGEAPLTPTLSIEVGCFRLRSLIRVTEIGNTRFRLQERGEGEESALP